MCEFVSKSINLLSGWDWAKVIQAVVGIWVATVATLALKTWKQQSKAQKKTDFMDNLTDTVHEFISLLSAPIEMVKYITIGIECYESLPRPDHNIENQAAIEYIKNDGKRMSKRLHELLEPCARPLSKINSLVAKGQVLGFSDYNVCQVSCKIITAQYDRIQALCYMIGNESANWENPKIQETLSKVIALDESDIRKEINEFNSKFLTFVKKNYGLIYK